MKRTRCFTSLQPLSAKRPRLPSSACHVAPLPANKKPSDQPLTPPVLGDIKRAGPYLLGPRIGSSPVRSIVPCLARKEGTDDFFTIKILTLEDSNKESQDDRQGKMLIHTEYSLLSLLKNQDGVIHHHGLFKDEAWEERETLDRNGHVEFTGRRRKRLCLVLDCLIPHGYSDKNTDLMNLQHYVIKEKKLSEKEAVIVFYDIIRVVESLHKKNIVHRDLKLGNMVLNKRTRRILITNFCLGKHLVCETDLLKDQRGSPAYISPDVLSGKPYLGKPSDMWALGVVLFTMLYGQFPFYDSIPQELFRKIKSAEFRLPPDVRISEKTKSIVCKLLIMNPQDRMTASQVLDALTSVIASWQTPANSYDSLQVVPDIGSESDNEEDTQSDDQSRGQQTRASLSEFETSLFTANSDNVLTRQQPRPPTIKRRVPPTKIPIRRLDTDARPLNQAEIVAHSSLIFSQRT
ncbi:hypothetical protein CHS0354_027973 [Potamilus streckersoni]|uniref:Serine/threonine-protein kinase 40 n=1 Tax=Potamilus streckersoni TaxID=2493646 RepID=A0AAE0T4E4_9BIVA|nr:hypothetical protein CHS0354_027973 [Potamilus streckersoni]